MKAFNLFCRVGYESTMLLFLLLIILIPIHRSATRHFNIDHTFNSCCVSFHPDENVPIREMDLLPVYRLQPGLQFELGKVRLEELIKNEALCSFDPSDFRWPMGRQGRIVEDVSGTIKVDMGTNLAFSPGNILYLFQNRDIVGTIEIQKVFDSYSLARVLQCSVHDLRGLTASEYTVATQVAFFSNRWLARGEAFIFFMICVAYVWAFWKWKLSPLIVAGGWLKNRIKVFPWEYFRIPFHLLMGIPFVWFISNLFALSVSHFLPLFMNLCSTNKITQIIWLQMAPWFVEHVRYLYVLGGILYCVYIYGKRSSPILAFWNSISYHAGKKMRLRGHSIVIWFLHLVIAYAFATTLTSFLAGNLNAMLDLAWPNSGVRCMGFLSYSDLHSSLQWFASLGKVITFMLTHRPQFLSLALLLQVLNYILWSLTIVGCLYGYGHSVLSFLWGKRIRNLDFSLVGWLTNASCYPLFGVVIWRMFPSAAGIDPVATQGPCYYLMLFLGFFSNLLYTLSIWNLGTMFGVMTDKGVRTTGFYSVVRHPSYTLESIMIFSMAMISFTKGIHWIGAGMWFLLYFLRSEREDNFMSCSNPLYIPYTKHSPFKFIPGIY